MTTNSTTVPRDGQAAGDSNEELELPPDDVTEIVCDGNTRLQFLMLYG